MPALSCKHPSPYSQVRMTWRLMHTQMSSLLVLHGYKLNPDHVTSPLGLLSASQGVEALQLPNTPPSPGRQGRATLGIHPAPVVNLPGGRQIARLQGVHKRLSEARHQRHQLFLAALLHSRSHHLWQRCADARSIPCNPAKDWVFDSTRAECPLITCTHALVHCFPTIPINALVGWPHSQGRKGCPG